jgi:hypothetical protein
MKCDKQGEVYFKGAKNITNTPAVIIYIKKKPSVLEDFTISWLFLEL